MIIENITELIGNTPIIKVPSGVHGIKNLNLYCKMEYWNAFGSIKDRVALNLIKDDLKGCKKNDKIVLEASSGNTAKALALISSINNLRFKTVTNRIKTPEVRELLLLMGANIQELPGWSECPDPHNPNDYMTVAKNLAENKSEDYFYTDQYFNEKNPEAHKATGQEIVNDLKKVDYFFTFLGTCGSSIGVGSVLKEEKNSKIVGIVASKSNYVPGGRTEDELWDVGFYDREFYDDLISGSVEEAVLGMKTLIRKVGLLCGPTSGLSYQKTIDYFKKNPLKKKTNCVFVACDRAEQYLSYLKKYSPELIGSVSGKNKYYDVSGDDISKADEISVDEFKKIIDDVLVVDIRSEKSFSMINIKNSVNIPEALLEDMFNSSIPFSKNRKIVVVCPMGTKSKRLTALLKKEGYDACNLKGGFGEWIKFL